MEIISERLDAIEKKIGTSWCHWEKIGWNLLFIQLIYDSVILFVFFE
jgi:hypothetical protein